MVSNRSLQISRWLIPFEPVAGDLSLDDSNFFMKDVVVN